MPLGGLTRYRALGFRHTVGAAAKRPELIHGEDRFMAIGPCDEDRPLTEWRQCMKPLAGQRNLTFDRASARLARASAAEVLKREDTVVAVGPLHAHGVAAHFVKSLDICCL